MPIKKELSTLVSVSPDNYSKTNQLLFPKQKITTINKLQNKLSCNVKIIDLSQNVLSSLQGIQQFTNLQQLNISSNKIKNCSQLLRLKHLEKLSKLYVKSNPFLNEPLDEQFVQLVSHLNTDLPILKQKNNQVGRQSHIYQTTSNNSQFNKKSLSHSNRSRNLQNNMSQQKLKETHNYVEIQALRNQNLRNYAKISDIRGIPNMRAKLSEQFIVQQNQNIQQKQSSLQISQQQLKLGVHLQKNKNQQKFFVENKLKIAQLKRNYSKNQKQQNLQETNRIRKRQLSTNLTPRRRYSNSKSKQQQFFIQTTSNKDKSNNKSNKDKQIKNYKTNNKDKSVKNTTRQNRNNHDSSNWQNLPQNKNHITIERINNLSIQKTGEIKSGIKILSSSRKNIQMEVDNMMINIDSQDINLNYGSIIQKEQDESYQLQFDFMNKEKQNNPNSEKQLSKSDYKISAINEKQNQLINKNAIKDIKKQLKIESTQRITQTLHKQYQSPTFLAITPHFTNQSEEFKNHLSNQTIYNENIQNSYYKHLVSVNPSLTLLYSSIPSLSTSQKNILLQILFKNHKQLFVELTKQHLYREQTKINLNEKSFHLDSLTRTHQQLQGKINQLKFSSEKQIRIIQLLTVQKKQNIKEKEDLKKALKSRQKIIEDLQIEFKRLKKGNQKIKNNYEQLLQQDQKQQRIIKRKQNTLKKQYFAKILLQYKNCQKISKIKNKMEKTLMLKSWRAFKNYQLVNLYIKTKHKLKEQNLIKESFNGFKLNLNQSKKQKVLSSLLKRWHQKQTFTLILKHKSVSLLKKSKIKKADKTFLNKFFACWSSNIKKIVNHEFQNNQLAITSNNIKSMRKYFSNLKQTVKTSKLKEISLIDKLKLIQEKLYFNQFTNIMMQLEKSRQIKTNKLTNCLKNYYLTFLLTLTKKKISFKKKKTQNNKVSEMQRLRKFFSYFKKGCFKTILIKNKSNALIVKLSQNLRIKDLITQFKTNLIFKNIIENQKKQLVSNLRNNQIKKKQRRIKVHVYKNLMKKKFQIKWKWTIFNVLFKHMVLSKHSKILQKYEKQSQISKINFQQTEILNQRTIQTLKGQVQLYTNELIFHKSQIQKLSQRQMIILSEKEEYLLQLRERQAVIQQLNSRLSLQSMQRSQLNKKYDKILDLYAETVDQYQHSKIKHHKNQQFLYDTINQGDITCRTLRKQPKRTISPVRDFCSLKNKYQKNV